MRPVPLVARGTPAFQVFNELANEMGPLLKVEYAAVQRYENDESTIVVGSWSRHRDPEVWPAVGERGPLREGSIPDRVLRTGRAMAQIGTYDPANGSTVRSRRNRRIRSAIGSPIVAGGSVWGLLVACWDGGEPRDEVEEWMYDFAVLVATAITSSESRAELTASRARVVAAGDEARRRLERDLHDGVQQRLIALGVELRLAESDVSPADECLRERLSQAVRSLMSIVDDLREIARGIHPAILSRGGLEAALNTLARRSAVPVIVTVEVGRRLGDRVEVTVYYSVCEALTNAVKHANPSRIEVDLRTDGAVLRLSVHDDGVGGADPVRGTGLIGLRDRVEALGGSMCLTSPPGRGTTFTTSIPIDAGLSGPSGAASTVRRRPAVRRRRARAGGRSTARSGRRGEGGRVPPPR
ncbi:GAF domain-containing sensor histidine kinase [Actinoallomurus sp. CA-142502]|uniref:GAF domain-containing sensor histidine kinase n=1 Tax=Actinoallomurus sp. CA-142502 TaxID=3239885 RepID=UPI003D929B3C